MISEYTHTNACTAPMNFADDLDDRKNTTQIKILVFFASMYSNCDRDRQAIIFQEVNKSCIYIERFSKEITTKTLIHSTLLNWYCANDLFIYKYIFYVSVWSVNGAGVTNTKFHLKLPQEIEVEKESALAKSFTKREKKRRKEQKDHRNIRIIVKLNAAPTKYNAQP